MSNTEITLLSQEKKNSKRLNINKTAQLLQGCILPHSDWTSFTLYLRTFIKCAHRDITVKMPLMRF